MINTATLAGYIDPGTGSMLFTLLIGVLSTSYFVLRKGLTKARFMIEGGKTSEADKDRHSIVMFADDKRYWNVFEPLCDEFERRGIDAEYWTASPDDPALDAAYEHVHCEFIGEGNRAFARLNVMSADVCVATTPGLQVYQWKRSKDVDWYVHVFHSVGTAAGYRMFGLDYYDAVVIAGDYQEQEIRTLEELRGIHKKELVPGGCTYLDTMMQRAQSAGSAKAHERTTVLVAPSWGPTSLLCAYGERLLKALSQTDYNVIIRPHPQSKTADKDVLDRLMQAYPNGERFFWNFDNDNSDVLATSDIMITDFSGVAFDYALVFDRPLIYREGSYDDDPYDSAWLVDSGEELWKFRAYRRLGVPFDEEQLEDVGAAIARVLADDALREERARVRREAWNCQGEGAARTVDYLVQAKEAIDKRKEQDNEQRYA